MVSWASEGVERWGLLPMDEPRPSLSEPLSSASSGNDGSHIAASQDAGRGSESEAPHGKPRVVLPPDPAALGTPS